MIPPSGLADLVRTAGLLIWLGSVGCTTVTSGSGNAASHAAAVPRERPRPVSHLSPFGEPAAETAVAARPDTSEPTVRPTAWAKLKGAIGRSSPQPIPLPADTESDEDKAGDRPFVTVDGRDF